MRENKSNVFLTHRNLEKQLLIVVVACGVNDLQTKWRLKVKIDEEITWMNIVDLDFKLSVFNGKVINIGDELLADLTIKYIHSALLNTYLISGYEVYNIHSVRSRRI